MHSQQSGSQFNNRFQGKTDFVTKDGVNSMVSKAANPIKKGSRTDMMLASQGSMAVGSRNSSKQNAYRNDFNQIGSPMI